ncbi:hypothetical protein AT483_15875 [Escherichia coli]
MVSENKAKILNPIITLLKPPTPEAIPVGGKSRKNIVGLRLKQQREVLSSEIDSILRTESEIVKHRGKYHIVTSMFEDSYAPSFIPDSLFCPSVECKIVAPAYNGYLIEVNSNALLKLKNKINNAKAITDLVDISRVRSVSLFDSSCTLRNSSLDSLWNTVKALNTFQFNVWLMPFFDELSRESVVSTFLNFLNDGIIAFGYSDFDIKTINQDAAVGGDNIVIVPPLLIEAIKKYRKSGQASVTVTVETKDSLNRILNSSAVYRIDPVSPLNVTDTPPGNGAEPVPPILGDKKMPTVVVIDGGCNAKSYSKLNIYKLNPLIPDHDADCKHGNKVVSLLCHGYAWNNNLNLPKLQCSYISAQAIAKRGVLKQPTPDQFLNYLRMVADKTSSIAKVWNLSFNEDAPHYNCNEISYLGHKISLLAREFGILPVISIGNVSKNEKQKNLCPPADCESGITVSGRTANHEGMPSDGCPLSRKGPAPAGMKKPELSWFSRVRVIGGTVDIGTSFSAPLVSSIAAHTFSNIKNATPDLVRALLINRSELLSHDDALGWGTPWDGDLLPWYCKDGSVTLTWISKLKAGAAYYWNDLPLPPEMLVNGKLVGEISLTAILKPKVSEFGSENYFSTRLQCSLQAIKEINGTLKTESLLGSMKESSVDERKARNELSKWSPIRHHAESFKRKDITGCKIRLYARIYARDLYQYGLNNQRELEEQEVSFVLTFKSVSGSSSIYTSMVQQLGVYVESAVIDNHINIDVNK